MSVDVHAHWLPEELFSLPPGSPVPPLNGRDGQLHLGDLPLSIETAAMSDADRVLADTDAAGLASRVLSAPPFAFPVADAAGVAEYVGSFNEHLARVCRDSDGRLLGLGLVSLHDPAAAAAQMDTIKRSELLRGIAVPPLLGATTFDAGPLREVVEIAADRGLAVLVHPMQLPRPEWSSYYLANLIGNPTETATAAAALVLGGVLDKLPDLRICLLHGGGCAPALLGRWQHGWQQRADVRSGGGRPPAEGFAGLWFDTLTHDGPTLELLRAHADPDHLMCGSDYPFDMGVARPLELPRAAGLTDDLLARNARRFLGLDEGETHA
ncbi:amidohydrolase [Mycolicibacterium wolinskyi]|uniref:2-hydroxy-3-carboxy-6-oxo-7-methylocta-2, 4-dienoate decarboxylase n=1 Tax=Mycolicibacterium wolinskyi TaxID=59750 RepID=A0A1X2F8Y1_9MYCO|nr:MULTISPECIES: amidohydrolase family protein [Mycolicibacterium]MCV7284394.1 amidohydrolase [Mycolicibacterium wolinskyi]MCV7298016.1 amidohydrolase [Mycolicibacterium goodii]ORX14429.1 2-hydroxy-3-carboxy-6-oxo-7-methylocta-2,4-dienoate decarboxylase [Mycolicibacterium wolinskyi]